MTPFSSLLESLNFFEHTEIRIKELLFSFWNHVSLNIRLCFLHNAEKSGPVFFESFWNNVLNCIRGVPCVSACRVCLHAMYVSVWSFLHSMYTYMSCVLKCHVCLLPCMSCVSNYHVVHNLNLITESMT